MSSATWASQEDSATSLRQPAVNKNVADLTYHSEDANDDLAVDEPTMMWKRFAERKRQVIEPLVYADQDSSVGFPVELAIHPSSSKPDRSLRQAVDFWASRTCQALNACQDYYTTSSCSGRVSIFGSISSEQKETNIAAQVEAVTSGVSFADRRKNRGFLVFVDHGEPGVSDAANSVVERGLCGLNHTELARVIVDRIQNGIYHYKTTPNKIERGAQPVQIGQSQQDAWLRVEPLLIHVRCRTIVAAFRLLQVCRMAGLKEVGITGGDESRGFDIRICGSTRMAVPIKINGHYVIDPIANKEARQPLSGREETRIGNIQGIERCQQSMEGQDFAESKVCKTYQTEGDASAVSAIVLTALTHYLGIAYDLLAQNAQRLRVLENAVVNNLLE